MRGRHRSKGHAPDSADTACQWISYLRRKNDIRIYSRKHRPPDGREPTLRNQTILPGKQPASGQMDQRDHQRRQRGGQAPPGQAAERCAERRHHHLF